MHFFAGDFIKVQKAGVPQRGVFYCRRSSQLAGGLPAPPGAPAGGTWREEKSPAAVTQLCPPSPPRPPSPPQLRRIYDEADGSRPREDGAIKRARPWARRNGEGRRGFFSVRLSIETGGVSRRQLTILPAREAAAASRVEFLWGRLFLGKQPRGFSGIYISIPKHVYSAF